MDLDSTLGKKHLIVCDASCRASGINQVSDENNTVLPSDQSLTLNFIVDKIVSEQKPYLKEFSDTFEANIEKLFFKFI